MQKHPHVYNGNKAVSKKRKQLSIEQFTQVKKKVLDNDAQPYSVPSPPQDVGALKLDPMPKLESTSLQYQNDLGMLYHSASRQDNAKKYDILCNVWRPDAYYKFPLTSLGQKFQYKWLEDYSWLAYSPGFDGAFCLTCVLFAESEGSRNAHKLYQSTISR